MIANIGEGVEACWFNRLSGAHWAADHIEAAQSAAITKLEIEGIGSA
jgi:hypothetical protein